MEKKNTILLTVIAIATLLVAVVGATFAYFTAQVTTTNDANNTVNAKTYALTEVQMNYGSKVESKGMYPGTTIVKDVTISANCPAGSNDCEPVNTQLTIETIDSANVFGNDVRWTLYKMDSTTRDVTCTIDNKTTTGKYYAETSCTGFTAATDVNDNVLDHGTIVRSHVGAGTEVIDIKAYGKDITNATATEAHNDKYYLVVEYLNNESTTQTPKTDSNGDPVIDSSGNQVYDTTVDQNKQQGEEFSVEMTFASKA